mgnify:CR=1 FL=1
MVQTRLLIAFAAFSVVSTAPASAGRFCGATLEGGTSSGATEAEARTAAQGWWSSRAGSRGRGYQNWDVAQDKSIKCDKKADGSFRCTASAKPCLPDGAVPEDVPKIEM